MRRTSNRKNQDLPLFWISCMSLFFEILMIRWLSAEVRIFSYFHNLVLLFCFLGIGLGCLLTKKEAKLAHSFAIIGIFVLLIRLSPYMGIFSIKNISSLLSLGTNFLIWHRPVSDRLDLTVLAFLGGTMSLLCCMALLMMMFVPFGQFLGRLFNEHDRPLRAYGVNILGSITGVWFFAVLSWFSTPPAIWFAVGGFGCLPFLLGRRRLQQVLLAGCLLIASVLGLVEMRTSELNVWSPYQKLTVRPLNLSIKGRTIRYGYSVLVNSTGYMLMTNYTPQFMQRYPSLYPSRELLPYDHYNVPYQFTDQRDHVLIVGSGAGNDVAGALRNGAHAITAVDIDPVIIQLGRQLHPEAPYSNPRVSVVNDDARSFFKKTTDHYDLIVFGLLDSHTLSSSYSNVRLDNYVYTLESFREARRLLKPTGVLVVIFEVTDDFIGARLQKILTTVFGQRPIGFEVRSGFRGWGGYGFVAGDRAAIERKLSTDARLKELVERPHGVFDAWSASGVGPTTDDWPYLYLARHGIPILYFVVFGLLILFSIIGVKQVVGQRHSMQWHFFFLGAGFLLLEVQNISKSALLFGTTWMVNTVVISAVLIMVLLANAVVITWPVRALRTYYFALLLTLGVNFLIPFDLFSQMPVLVKGFAAAMVMSLPIFFAGVIFSTSFARATNRSGAFASNLIGATVGGMAECLSFVTGIKSLLFVAAVFYILAWSAEGQHVGAARRS